MGQLVYIEQIRIERQAKIRDVALRNFPWKEINSVNRYILDPMIETMSKPKQTIVQEAVFRLIYEAFVLGLTERSSRRSTPANSEYNRPDADLQDQLLRKLVRKIMDAFVMFRWFHYRMRKSLQIIFDSLAAEWFIRGAKSTFQIK